MVSFWSRAALSTLSQTAKCHAFPFADVLPVSKVPASIDKGTRPKCIHAKSGFYNALEAGDFWKIRGMKPGKRAWK
jgi:hypothetical protein